MLRCSLALSAAFIASPWLPAAANDSDCFIPDVDTPDVPPSRTELLQVKLDLEPHTLEFVAEAKPLLMEARPLRWLHIPKTGTSWVNVLLHTPGLCPLLPPGFIVDRDHFCKDCDEYDSGLLDHVYEEWSASADCPGSFGDHLLGSHYAVGHQQEQYAGHGVTLLRNPQTRIVSAYNHHLWDWPNYFPQPKDLMSYAEKIQGCSVRALTRESPLSECCNYCHLSLNPMAESVRSGEVEEAKRMLGRLLFVGIMEEWNLSVCLWHVKFGGLCYGSDLQNVRKAGEPNVTLSNPNPATVEDLGGFVDKADTELYEHGQQLFRRDMAKYGVSMSACQPCFDHASRHWLP